MRINYYRFPEGVDPHTRYINGAINKGGHCSLGRTSCRGCEFCEDGWPVARSRYEKRGPAEGREG